MWNCRIAEKRIIYFFKNKTYIIHRFYLNNFDYEILITFNLTRLVFINSILIKLLINYNFKFYAVMSLFDRH